MFENVDEKMVSVEETIDVETKVGPLSVLQDAVTNNIQVMVNCRNNSKLLGRVKTFDRHMNMVLENVREMWNVPVRKGKGKMKKPIAQDRFVPKMFLRGDSVMIVLKNPLVLKQ